MADFEKEAKVQAWILIGPILVGGFMALLLPMVHPLNFLFITCGVVGSWLVLKSKLSEKRRTRKVISWGFKEMNTPEKKRYVAGYVLLGLATAYTIYNQLGML